MLTPLLTYRQSNLEQLQQRPRLRTAKAKGKMRAAALKQPPSSSASLHDHPADFRRIDAANVISARKAADGSGIETAIAIPAERP